METQPEVKISAARYTFLLEMENATYRMYDKLSRVLGDQTTAKPVFTPSIVPQPKADPLEPPEPIACVRRSNIPSASYPITLNLQAAGWTIAKWAKAHGFTTGHVQRVIYGCSFNKKIISLLKKQGLYEGA